MPPRMDERSLSSTSLASINSASSSASTSSTTHSARLSTPSSNESDPEVVRLYRESMYPTLLSEMIGVVLEQGEAYLFTEQELTLLRALYNDAEHGRRSERKSESQGTGTGRGKGKGREHSPEARGDAEAQEGDEEHTAGQQHRLSYGARYVLSRLIQRKDGWIRMNKLNNWREEIADLDRAVEELNRPLPSAAAGVALGSTSSQPPQQGSASSQSAPQPDSAAGPLRFVLTEADMDADLAPLLNLLTLDELKVLAKKMQRLTKATTTKAKIIEALLNTKSQTLLGGFAGASSSSSNLLAAGNASPAKRSASGSAGASRDASPEATRQKKKPTQMKLNFGGGKPLEAAVSPSPSRKAGSPSAPPVSPLASTSAAAQHGNQDALLRSLLTELIGKCVRLDPSARALIDRVALVYYRGNLIQGASALTTAVLARSRKRNYPLYEYSRTPNLWPTRQHLLDYERVLALEAQTEELIEWDGSKEALETVYRIFESIWADWKQAVAECEAGLPEGLIDRLSYHRMRFHAGWVMTRIIYKGMYVLGRFKLYEREKEVLRALLQQRVFRRGKRGDWYDRLALILMQYSDDKTQGRKQALAVCVQGLQDPNTHLRYHDALQRRIARLENALRIPFAEKHDFSYAKLQTSTEVTFHGVRLDEMVVEKQKLDLFGRPVVSTSPESSKKKEGRPSMVGDSSADSIDVDASPSKGFVERQALKKSIKVERRIPELPKAEKVAAAPLPMEGGDGGDRFETARRDTRISMASVWRGLDGEPCRVEALSLQHYAEQGFRG